MKESSKYDESLFTNSVTMRYIVKTCKNNDIDLYLFSNAPHVWCKTIIESMHLDKHITEDQIISSDHDIFQGLLKPHKAVYDTFQKYVSHQHHDDCLELVYVDDSFQNLMPVMRNPYWRPIFFNKEGACIRNNRMYTIRNLTEMNAWL
jgi:FMN phosphatase YigB (HAD superfamily)